MKLKIAVCDDEEVIRELLKEKIENCCLEKKVEYDIKLFENGDDFLKNYDEDTDILFLDMEMPGKNGLDVAKEIRTVNSGIYIVFITSYREYVFESFKVNAFRYILKPIKEDEFNETMYALIDKFYKNDDVLKFEFNGSNYSIRFDDIICIEVMNRKIWIYCTNETYRWVGTLNEFNQNIKDKGFFRISRSFIINISKVVKYNNKKVELEQGYEFQISRYKVNEFKEAYIRWCGAKLYD